MPLLEGRVSPAVDGDVLGRTGVRIDTPLGVQSLHGQAMDLAVTDPFMANLDVCAIIKVCAISKASRFVQTVASIAARAVRFASFLNSFPASPVAWRFANAGGVLVMPLCTGAGGMGLPGWSR